jgi:hypothetical protein
MEEQDNVIPLRPQERREPEERVGLPDDEPTLVRDEMRRMLRDESLNPYEELALVDEDEFSRRFAVRPRKTERGWILDFQKEWDLSNREVRWLIRSGSIKTNGDALRFSSSRFVAFYGWFCITSLWFFVGVPLVGGAYFAKNSDRALVIAAVGFLLLLAATQKLWLFFHLPQYLERKWRKRRL